GRQFPVAVLGAVTAEAAAIEAPLRELQAAELLREGARWPVPFVAFKHTLIQEATYRGLLRRRRQELHLAAVEALESLYADRLDGFAGMAAVHAGAAGAARRALDPHLRAGAGARRVDALEEALGHYSAALDAAARLGLGAADPQVRRAGYERGAL